MIKIEDLEADINFFLENMNIINPHHRYAIENDINSEYHEIYQFWESIKTVKNINESCLIKKSEVINSLKIKETDFLKTLKQLEIKFNKQKINYKLNKILTIITFGLFNWNQKLEQKNNLLDQIKMIKLTNIGKLDELQIRIDNLVVTNKLKTYKEINNEEVLSKTNTVINKARLLS